MPRAIAPTTAVWTGDEFGSGSFEATVIPPPTMADCNASPLSLSWPVVWVDFDLPAGYSTPSTDIAWSVGRTLATLESVTPSTFSPGVGAEHRANFFGPSLTDQLGASPTSDFYLAMSTIDGTWESTPVYARFVPVLNVLGTLIIGWTCTPEYTP